MFQRCDLLLEDLNRLQSPLEPIYTHRTHTQCLQQSIMEIGCPYIAMATPPTPHYSTLKVLGQSMILIDFQWSRDPHIAKAEF